MSNNVDSSNRKPSIWKIPKSYRWQSRKLHDTSIKHMPSKSLALRPGNNMSLNLMQTVTVALSMKQPKIVGTICGNLDNLITENSWRVNNLGVHGWSTAKSINPKRNRGTFQINKGCQYNHCGLQKLNKESAWLYGSSLGQQPYWEHTIHQKIETFAIVIARIYSFSLHKTCLNEVAEINISRILISWRTYMNRIKA